MKTPSEDQIRWGALLIVTATVTFLFLDMVRPFLVALVLAAITADMSRDLQKHMMRATGDRRGLAAGLTLGVLFAAVLAPLLAVAWAAAGQAQGIGDGAQSLVAEFRAGLADGPIPDWAPWRDEIAARSDEIASKLGELIGAAGRFAASSLGQLALGTAQFFLKFFVYLYALFLFLQLDTSVIDRVLSYSGLSPTTREEFSERMISVSRATIKGTLVIGLVQGALGGLGFWVAGIDGAAFWAVVMAVVSIVPGLGPTFVVFCGVVWLLVQGNVGAAVGLALWGAGVVGTVDNVLRPRLVGRDAALPEVFILISTLGGLGMFGAPGLVLGPVIAGLFVTMWTAFAETARAGAAAAPATAGDAVSRSGSGASSPARSP